MLAKGSGIILIVLGAILFMYGAVKLNQAVAPRIATKAGEFMIESDNEEEKAFAVRVSGFGAATLAVGVGVLVLRRRKRKK